MAWIRIIEEDEATGLLKKIYKRSKKQGSEASEVVKVFSLRPDLMDVRVRFGQHMTFGGSGLGRFREELIAVSISAACQCRY